MRSTWFQEKITFLPVTKSELNPGGVESGNQDSIQQLHSNGCGFVELLELKTSHFFLHWISPILHIVKDSPSLDAWIGEGC